MRQQAGNENGMRLDWHTDKRSHLPQRLYDTLPISLGFIASRQAL